MSLLSFRRSKARVNEKLAQLKSLEARTVDDASLPLLRGKLVDFAKETACSIRRLNVGGVGSRPWQPGQNPLATTPDKKPADANSNFHTGMAARKHFAQRH